MRAFSFFYFGEVIVRYRHTLASAANGNVFLLDKNVEFVSYVFFSLSKKKPLTYIYIITEILALVKVNNDTNLQSH